MLDMGLPARSGGWAPLSDRVGRVDPAPSRAPGPARTLGALDAGEPGFLDIPCSMLLRDLAAVCGDAWVPTPAGHVVVAPKGSRIVVDGPDACEVVAVLRSAGPKVLQVFALALDLWAAGTGGRDPAVPSIRSVGDFSRALTAGAHAGRDHEAVRSLLDALGRVRFEGGPLGRGPRREGAGPGSAAGDDPGAPLRLHPAPPPSPGAGSELIAFSPGPAWVRGLVGSGYRVARLPRSFLGLHARNDRYRILLAWYLAIMLRVNRKHGFRYRVGLRMLLEGAGIGVPDRNVSRFLAAIYRALEDIPDVRVHAPPLSMYDPFGMLAAMVEVSLEPVRLADYAT
jgi:hypothetical protein